MIDWERTHDWLLHCFAHDLAQLTILFDHDRPSLRELMALRKSLPEFGDLSPAAARERARAIGRVALEEMWGPEARRLAVRLQHAGLRTEIRNTSYISYLPIDRTTGAALLIEDEAESRRVTDEMLRAGIPVAHFAE
jgi:hypothetical protein